MSSDCKNYSEKLSEYLEGDLILVEEKAIEEHLAGCSGCQKDLKDLRGLLHSLESLRGEAVSRQLWPAIHAKLHPPSRGWSLGWHLIPRPVLALAAVLLAVVIGLWFQDFPGHHDLTSNDKDRVLAPEQPVQEWFLSMPSLLADSQKEIDPLLASVVQRMRMIHHPYTLRVEGYRRPQEAAHLSELRARRAMEALVTSGIPQERIFLVDKGLTPESEEDEDSSKGDVRLVLEPVNR
ncbi:MAG: zf-HC2 domain-containing protein [Deltaproteobacteria bacterium]|nr:zf-HC2 domain-containing protein [Deltaproteobacteria bacterium]